jgi:hypothetical protein
MHFIYKWLKKCRLLASSSSAVGLNFATDAIDFLAALDSTDEKVAVSKQWSKSEREPSSARACVRSEKSQKLNQQLA